jgi:hypothetical protein
MKIEIKRCVYRHDIKQEVVNLGHELKQALNVSPRIRWGGPGQMDVLVNGTAVFSRKTAGRMPKPGEVVSLLRSVEAAGRGGC